MIVGGRPAYDKVRIKRSAHQINERTAADAGEGAVVLRVTVHADVAGGATCRLAPRKHVHKCSLARAAGACAGENPSNVRSYVVSSVTQRGPTPDFGNCTRVLSQW